MTEAFKTELRESADELSQMVSRMVGTEVKMTVSVDKDRKGVEHVSVDSGKVTDIPTPMNWIISSYRVGSYGHIWTGEKNDVEVASFRLNMQYDHHGTGSNGHEMMHPWDGRPMRLTFVSSANGAMNCGWTTEDNLLK